MQDYRENILSIYNILTILLRFLKIPIHFLIYDITETKPGLPVVLYWFLNPEIFVGWQGGIKSACYQLNNSSREGGVREIRYIPNPSKMISAVVSDRFLNLMADLYYKAGLMKSLEIQVLNGVSGCWVIMLLIYNLICSIICYFFFAGGLTPTTHYWGMFL